MEVASGRPRRWIQVDHARSLLAHKLEGGPLRAFVAPLRLLPGSFRIPYPGDDLFWARFRNEPGSGPPSAG